MLETNNMPVMTSLQHWDHGFSSPFKSEIYFVSTRRFQDLKWGTKNPIMMRDPEFGPVRLRAYGTYTIRVTDPALFMTEIVGTDGEFTTDEIAFQLRNVVVSRFSNALAKSGIAVLDMAGHTDELAEMLRKRIAPELAAYGIETPTLLIENVSLPAEVEKVLDKRTSMGIVGDLGKYAQFQAGRGDGRGRCAARLGDGRRDQDGYGRRPRRTAGAGMVRPVGGRTRATGGPDVHIGPTAGAGLDVRKYGKPECDLSPPRVLASRASLTRITRVWISGASVWTYPRIS
jgi:Putative virion core protein (lumpy skin disease virus)